MSNKTLLIFLALLVLTLNGAGQDKKPNFLIIYVDDLGYNDLGCYGAMDQAIKTPNIDRMAAEGIRFTNWTSACSVCAPSRAALLTGRYPNRCGLPVGNNGNKVFGDNFDSNIGLQQSEITIPEVLKQSGYMTAMYGKAHLGADVKFYPLRHGFEEYYGSLFNFPIGGTNPVLEGDSIVDPAMKYQDIHIKLTNRTIDFMKKSQRAEKPFFIYLSHYLCHGPWDPNRKFATEKEWEVYQNQPVKGHLKDGGDKIYPALVRELDWHVGEVLKAINNLDIDKNTFVALISDNGPWLPAGSAWPLRGGKYNTFEGGHRVPSIARWPDKIPAGQVSDALCSTLDYFPTIAHLAGVDLPAYQKIDGISIWPILRGDKNTGEPRILYYYNGITLEAIREGKWKLHLPREPSMKVYWAKGNAGGYQSLDKPILFNLENDVEEKLNVADQYPVVVERLLNQAEKAREDLGDWSRKGSDQKTLLNYSGNPNSPVRIRN